MTIEKLQRHRSPGIDQIPTEMIKAGGRTIRCEIHKLIISIWNKEWSGRSRALYVPVYKKGDKTECSNYRVISLL